LARATAASWHVGTRLDLSKPPAKAPKSIRGTECNLSANCAKANERKRKENRFLWLSFTFFYFSESRLFNGLQPKKVEKISPRPNSRPGLYAEPLNAPFLPHAAVSAPATSEIL
jgi:hypothetical protein